MRAYRHAVDQFLAHCELLDVSLQQITPALVSADISSMPVQIATPAGEPERFEQTSKLTRSLHLAALPHFFDMAQEHAATSRFGAGHPDKQPQEYLNSRYREPPRMD